MLYIQKNLIRASDEDLELSGELEKYLVTLVLPCFGESVSTSESTCM